MIEVIVPPQESHRLVAYIWDPAHPEKKIGFEGRPPDVDLGQGKVVLYPPKKQAPAVVPRNSNGPPSANVNKRLGNTASGGTLQSGRLQIGTLKVLHF